jgi:hypothetical protein
MLTRRLRAWFQHLAYCLSATAQSIVHSHQPSPQDSSPSEKQTFTLMLHEMGNTQKTTTELAEELKLDLKQTIIVTNRNGANVRRLLSSNDSRLSEDDKVLESYVRSCTYKLNAGIFSS